MALTASRFKDKHVITSRAVMPKDPVAMATNINSDDEEVMSVLSMMKSKLPDHNTSRYTTFLLPEIKEQMTKASEVTPNDQQRPSQLTESQLSQY